MSKKLLIEEVNSRLKQFNINLLGEYINCATKTRFQCYCGKMFETTINRIFTGQTRSCGCIRKEIGRKLTIDLTGRKFDRLEVIVQVDNKNKKTAWLCEYKCGKFVIINSTHLRRNNNKTKSCGCLNKEINQYKSGKNHPRYNASLTDEDRIRKHKLLKCLNWSKSIFKRDNYICQTCNQLGGHLNAHHIDGWDWCKERRFDLTNGITLCKNCHINFHQKYGYGNNTAKQFEDYKNESK